MLFNSFEFLIFLAVVYSAYRLLPFRGQNWLLLIASYVFYGWWDWRFLFLMIFTTSIDFWSGLIIHRGRLTARDALLPYVFVSMAALCLVACNTSKLFARVLGAGGSQALISDQAPLVLAAIPTFLAIALIAYRHLIQLPEQRRRKVAMIISIVIQLSVLGFFKYSNFFIDSLVTSLNQVGIAAAPRHFDIVLPVGISFYTFQSMSYAIDIYRRELEPTDRFFHYALCVSFFPQLVAGPIERARNLLPQMASPRAISREQIQRGLFLILFGLFKKVAIADGLAGTVDQAFAMQNATWGTVVGGTIAFAIQIYCDFSGYSDIARGVAKLFGVELMVNFNQPYFSKSPQEFWRRWHISLSTWLGDYLYKPLGGSRGGLSNTCRNLMLTMVLGGLWHGAAWNYVLWGGYHGTALSLHRVLTNKRGKSVDSHVIALLKIMGCGIFTLYGWMLFRSHSLDHVITSTMTILTGRGGLAFDAARPALSAVISIALLGTWELVQYRGGGDAKFYRTLPVPAAAFAFACIIFLTIMGTSNEPAQFIYFQF